MRTIRSLMIIVIIGVLMSVSETIKVYIDWDEDGFTADDLVTPDVMDGSVSIGILDPESRVASVGMLNLTMDNSDREYSPENSSGSHYGDLRPGKPVQVTADADSTTYTIFTGTLVSVTPTATLYGDRIATIIAEDKMSRYQRDIELSLPLREEVTADELLEMITGEVFGGAAASGEIIAFDHLDDGDTVTVDEQTYTYKDVLTPVANEVLTNQFDGVGFAGGYFEMVNLMNAINTGAHPGTAYAAATLRHPSVNASNGSMSIGIRDSERDGYVDIGDIASGYDGAGSTIAFGGNIISDPAATDEPTELGIRRLHLPLWKVGTPSGRTVTVSIYPSQGSNLPPDTTSLAYTGAQITFDADTLSATAGSYVTLDITDGILNDWNPNDSQLWWITVEIDGTASASDYIRWGSVASPASAIRFRSSTLTGSTWSTMAYTNVPLVWVPGYVDITAKAPGSYGNSIALSDSTADLTTPATLSGGSTGITTSFETGILSFLYAGDLWSSRDEANAMSAIDDVVRSEYGFFAIARNGQPTFKNKDFFFLLGNDTGVTIDNTHSAAVNPRISRDDIRNLITVSHVPRRTLTSGTIAQSSRGYKADAGTGTERWSTDDPIESGTTVIKLPFKDPSTERKIAAISVSPLVAGTNYNVTDDPNSGSAGTSYNSNTKFKVTYAITGSDIEVTLINNTTKVLYLHDLAVTGVGLASYDEEQIVQRDNDGIDTYGKMVYQYNIPIPVPESFLLPFAQFLLFDRKDPRFMIDGLEFTDPEHSAAKHMFKYEIFDLFAVDADQLGISSSKQMITGMEYTFAGAQVTSMVIYTRDVGSKTYWELGITNFSELGQTTTLAL
jgi:hypothetical protein